MSEPVTVEWVRERVAKIAAEWDDNEVAHEDEDNLHVTVLRAIADGTCADSAVCAREALKTLNIPFVRWFA